MSETIRVVKKAKPIKAVPKKGKNPSVICLGFDVSMSSIAGAARMYDSVLNKHRGPFWYIKRWQTDTPYFERMRDAVQCHDIVDELLVGLHGLVKNIEEVHIGIEEPWPLGLVKRAQSGWLKQQAQIQGAFIAGLLKWGYPNIYEVSIPTWQALVANDMDMKWSKKDGFDKWTIKEWAREVYPGIPDWPDLIRDKNGLKPQPKSSVAKPVQPDDRYDSTGIMELTWEYAHGRI